MKKLTYLFLLLVLTSAGTLIRAQQSPHFAHNMFNQMAFNPGYAGSNDAICVTGIIRQQWVGFQDEEGNDVAPETFLVSINSPVNILHGGLGATIMQDKIGFQKNIMFKLAYSYRFNLGVGSLGVGAQFGFYNETIDFSKFIASQEDDPILKPSGEESDMLFDAGFGAYYLVPNKYWVGLSTVRILQSRGLPVSENGESVYQLKRHYFLTAGYDFIWPTNSSFEITPSLLAKTDGAVTQVDLNALLKYNNKVWGGLSYSTFMVMDPLSVLVGMRIKDVRIGYSYGIPTSAIGSGGSHEIMLRYCFKIDIEGGRSSYRNTRFL